MRKNLLLPAIAAIFSVMLLNSCGEDEITFPYNLEDYPFCFEASTIIGPQEFSYTITKGDVEVAFNSVGASLNDIESAQLESLSIVVTDSAKSLNEIDGMQVHVRDVGSTSNGEMVAYVDNIADNSVAASFSMNGTQLKNWLVKDSFEVHIVAFNENNNSDEVCLKLTAGIISIKVSE